MLPQRVAVAGGGIPVIVGLTVLGGPVFAIAAGFVLTFAALEFYVATDPELAGSGAAHSLRDQRLPRLTGAARLAPLLPPSPPPPPGGQAAPGPPGLVLAPGRLGLPGPVGLHLVFLRDAPNGR